MPDMRELLEECFGPSPLDPQESVRQSMRANVRKRFYKDVSVEHQDGVFAVLLDGRNLRTPAKAKLAASAQSIADAMAREWDAQADIIDPATMPLTRLANSIIDGVAERRDEVAQDIIKYLGTDMVFYRADAPEGLIASQNEHWNPLLAWAHDTFGARFFLAEGIVHVTQPEAALDAIRKALPDDAWRLGAIHSATTLTGSALIALALAAGLMTRDQAWAAAYVDEDWNQRVWGRDEESLARRAFRWKDMEAVSLILDALR